MSDAISIVVLGLFIALTSLCVIAAKNFLGVSFLIACLIAVPMAFLIGIVAIWLLGKTGKGKK